jgi:hypothetical protein
MKAWFLWVTAFSAPTVYEFSALYFNLPDYFSWLIWILFWPVILIASCVRVIKRKYGIKKNIVILTLSLAYLPYVFGIMKLKSNLFFQVNKSVMEHFVKNKDADSLEKLKKRGVNTFGIEDGYEYFTMDTDSDWCWGYAYSLKKEKPKSNSWCPIEKWTQIDDDWFRWAK